MAKELMEVLLHARLCLLPLLTEMERNGITSRD